MAVQSRTDYSNLAFIRSGSGLVKEAETIKQDAGRSTVLAPLTVMGRRRFSLAASGTAGGTNTGNGTCTNVSKIANYPQDLIVGNYNLECTVTGVEGRAAGAVTPYGSNVGNGTVTAFDVASGEIPKVGNFVLTCVDANYNGTAAGSAVKTGTGNGTMDAIVPGIDAEEGDYVATCIDASVSGSEIFEVISPSGGKLKNMVVGVAYSTLHFTTTLNDGVTDFIVGDYWTITMTISHGGKFELADPDGDIIENNIALPGTSLGTVVVTCGGITFTITDGTTDFAVGDYFTMVIAAAQGGKFKLEDPHGNLIASELYMTGVVSGTTVFNVGGIKFTITDGTTDFAVGDTFAITVSADGDYVPLNQDDLLGGSEFASIFLGQSGDSIPVATLVAGDVPNCPMLVGGNVTVDENQLVFENSLTLTSRLPSGKSVLEEMEQLGIHVQATVDIDSVEN